MSDFGGSHPPKGLRPPWVVLGVRAWQAWLLGIPRSQLGAYKSTEATLAAQRRSPGRHRAYQISTPPASEVCLSLDGRSLQTLRRPGDRF